ncbi:hypothetical protein [uncultured Winogradskyella sp.]|uniref:hypothetical protein n=2 Tax=Winogradskyella TaxID=286104 RepID=UPI0030D93040
MENLCKIKKCIRLTLLAVLISSASMAQNNNLFVLKFEGEPYTKKNDSVEIVTIGTIISKKTKLIMNRDDVAYIINNEGDVYELHETGTFKHKELLRLQAIKSNNSYSREVMIYFWKEFTNTLSDGYNKSGFVYRGDYVNLIQPIDSTNLYSNEIRFEWEQKKSKTKPYYFVLRETGSDKATKIGTHDTNITLFIDDINLKYGGSYEWTVIESKYENLETTEFSLFKVLKETEYKTKQLELKALSEFLKPLGYGDSEIKDMFCKSYKTCL